MMTKAICIISLVVFSSLSTMQEKSLVTSGEALEASRRLIAAAAFGNVINLEAAISNGADVNYTNKNKASLYGICLNTTALHIAAHKGFTEIVKVLLKIPGTFINARDIANCTPLWYAVQAGHKEIIAHLLEKGACVDIPNEENFTVYYIAAQKGDLETIKLLLSYHKNTSPRQQQNLLSPRGTPIAWGSTPLHAAIEAENFEVLQVILPTCKSHINKKDHKGETPLHMAAIRNRLDMVLLLLENGADASLKTVGESSSHTPKVTLGTSLTTDKGVHLRRLVLMASGNHLTPLAKTALQCVPFREENSSVAALLLSPEIITGDNHQLLDMIKDQLQRAGARFIRFPERLPLCDKVSASGAFAYIRNAERSYVDGRILLVTDNPGARLENHYPVIEKIQASLTLYNSSLEIILKDLCKNINIRGTRRSNPITPRNSGRLEEEKDRDAQRIILEHALALATASNNSVAVTQLLENNAQPFEALAFFQNRLHRQMPAQSSILIKLLTQLPKFIKQNDKARPRIIPNTVIPIIASYIMNSAQ